MKNGFLPQLHVVKTGNEGRAAALTQQIDVDAKQVAMKVCGSLCSPFGFVTL